MGRPAASTDLADRNAIVAELDRVLASSAFTSARRSRRLLRYIVEHSLTYPGVHLKEYSIALDVFERNSSYDPSVDATVRVEAGRLRSRLRDYYAEEGHDSVLMIEVPKGSYSATFVSRIAPDVPASPPLANPPAARLLRPLRIYSLPVRWMLLLSFLFGCVLGFLAAH